MKKLILLMIVSMLFMSLFASPVRMVVRIDDPGAAAFGDFIRENADIAAYLPGEYLDLVIADSELLDFQQRYPELVITQTETQLKQNLLASRDLPGYRDYSTMQDELLSIQAQYPNLVNVQSLGTGWGALYSQTIPYYNSFNHQIWAVKLTNNVHTEADKPAVYFCGAHHAREPISMEVSMEILVYLTENYGTDAFVTDLLDNFQIWIVPLVNPDGHKIVIDQTDVWWRKNIRDNNSNLTFTTDDYYGYGSDGVDINRNYGWEWGYLSATDDITAPTHHGSGAFSEPETQAFKTLLESQPFIAGISYHTYGQYVLYPYGYVSNVFAPDYTELRALAVGIASQVAGQNGGYYTPMNSWELYPVSGGLDDWAYGELGIFAYTVEMATEFIPPSTDIPQIVQNNLQGALYFLHRLERSALKGNVTDAITGLALEATIWVEALDNSPIPRNLYKSNPQYGSFWRFLSPGSWTVRFVKEGYQDVVENITINNSGLTEIAVAMLPLDNPGITVRVVSNGNSNQPIQGASLIIDDVEESIFTSDANGEIYLPALYPGSYRINLSKEGFSSIAGMMDLQNGYRFSLIDTALLEDSFSSGLSLWTSSGAWGISQTLGYSGTPGLADSPSGNYQNNVNSSCRLTQAISLAGAEAINLQFRVKHDIALDGDFAVLEYSTNGTMWRALDYYNGNADWNLYSYDLSSLAGQNLFLRFSMVTNSSGRANGIFIDDFKLYVSQHQVVGNYDTNVSSALFTVYPNPSRDFFQIKWDGIDLSKQQIDLSIYNLRGQLVHTRQINSLTDGDRVLTLNLHELGFASGLYLVNISSKGKQITQKRIVYIR